MKNVFSKANALYLVSGALAVGVLLASGVFALAPYVAFLAPVAALGVGLPLIVGGAVLSVVAGVLSAVAIGKNNTISGKDVDAPSAVAIGKNNTISGKDVEISNLKSQLTQTKGVMNGENKAIAKFSKDDILECQERREKKEEVLDSVALVNLFEDTGSPEKSAR